MKLIRTVHYTVPYPGGEAPSGAFRIALLADLHNNIFPGLTEQIRREAPDIILIVGDMANKPLSWRKAGFGRAYALIKALAAEYPVYYAPGNHETEWKARPDSMGALYERYQKALERKGVIFLNNDSACVSGKGFSFRLSGLELSRALYERRPGSAHPFTEEDLEALLGPSDPSGYQILLSHTPVFFEAYRRWGADLVLSGHLHGGMIRFPGIGGLIGAGFSLFPEYDRGHFEEEEKHMIVTAGLGTHTLPVRVLNPRELAIIDLEKE
ncbi:MAG: metallophosphoesterase [Lachnospiraceae bacterium]|nr:metallophosphoesterase [Lachnospiraceae bacterium]